MSSIDSDSPSDLDQNIAEGINMIQHEELESLSDSHLDLERKGSSQIRETSNRKIVIEQDRFPFCIVWTALPGLTWLLPFVGHMGIADSRGVIHDFAAPYTVNEGNLAFGKTARYIQLNPDAVSGGAEAWDSAIQHADRIYSNRMHNLCCDNCHSHVATALSKMQYRGIRWWNMVILALYIFVAGRFATVGRTLQTFAPACIIYGLIALISLAF